MWPFASALRELGANPSVPARAKVVAGAKERYPDSQGVVFMADAMLQVLDAAAPSMDAVGSTSDGDGRSSAAAATTTTATTTAAATPAPPVVAAVKPAPTGGKRAAKTKEQLAREAKHKLVAKLAADRLKAEEKRKKRKAEAAAKKMAAKRQRASGVAAVQKKAGAASDGGVVVLLLGVLGSGKGTQGALLSSKLGWTHLSCGEILRTTRNSSGERGQRVKAALDHDRKLRAEGGGGGGGNFEAYETNLEVLGEILTETFKKGRATHTSFSIDGARDREQAEIIVQCAKSAGLRLSLAVTLELAGEAGIARALERGRGGDDRETLDRRAKAQSDGGKAQGVLQLLEERGIARKTIDASPGPPAVHHALLGAITSVLGDAAIIPTAAPAVAAAPLAAAAPPAAPPTAAAPASAAGNDVYSTSTDAYSGGGSAYSAYSSLTDAYSAGSSVYSSAPAPAAAAAAGPGGWALQSGDVWVNSGSGERVAKRDATYGVWTVELSRSQGMLYWYNKHTNARSYRTGAHAAKPPGL